MRKHKKLNYKKTKQKKRQKVTETVGLLKKYSVKQWLETIRKLNISHDSFEDINDQFRTKPEYLVVAADMAIRISRQKTNFHNPSAQQIYHLFGNEIYLTDGPKNLIKLFGIGGVSLLAAWQNRFNYNRANMLGRMHLLYEHYNEYIIENIDISIDDLYIILLNILVEYDHKKMTYFTKEAIISKDIPNLTATKVDNFLAYFAINQENYIEKAKADKIYEKSFGNFKYLVKYPIIEIETNLYITPVIEQLIDTISNNLYFLLLENFAKKSREESKKFLDEFGLILENYVLGLARNSFGIKKVVDANKIVKNKDEFRCEAVIIHNQKALAIEVKKMYFKRDAIGQMDKEHIDDLLEKHIVKAYQQIENTLQYILHPESFGLIVIPDIMLGLSAIKSYIKSEFKDLARFDDNIFICTLSSYEALMANTDDNIFLILDHVKKRKLNDGDDISQVINGMIKEGVDIKNNNEFLIEQGDKSLKKLEAYRKK